MYRVTICVLTYGDYPWLASRAIDSICRRFRDRSSYRLIVGANAVGEATREYLEALRSHGEIDNVYFSEANINKCPMMRRMFSDITTEFVWWFDDDSFVTDASALEMRLLISEAAPDSTVIWGHQFFFGHEADFSSGMDVSAFVRSARWFRGHPPPSWQPGGKGKFDFEGRGVGDGRWFFITGGCWFVRTSAIAALDWPDLRLIKRCDDVFLCEAIRQQGWDMQDIGPLGVCINAYPRRGEGEDDDTMARQLRPAP